MTAVLGVASRTVRVELGERSYEVVVGSGVLGPGLVRLMEIARSGPMSSFGPVRRALLVVDTGVPMSLREEAEAALRQAGVGVDIELLTPTERVKSVDTLARVLARAAACGLERNDVIVALGGGIVGDLAGFAAASYRRGVRFIQCPTTLLSMVDASVGGKTGVNLNVGTGVASGADDSALLKNMVGAFWQPLGVLAETQALSTLPARHLRAGLAECVKHALIARSVPSDDLLAGLPRLIAGTLALDAASLSELIGAHVALKARVVAGDERELAPSGGRALLNLGHTFGHAIETIAHLTPDAAHPQLAPLHHGEAVGLGLVAAAAAAVHARLLTPAHRAGIESLVGSCGLPTRVGGLPPTPEVAARMMHDKKSSAGRLRIILPVAEAGAGDVPTGPGSNVLGSNGLGWARVVRDPAPEVIAAGIEAIRA